MTLKNLLKCREFKKHTLPYILENGIQIRQGFTRMKTNVQIARGSFKKFKELYGGLSYGEPFFDTEEKVLYIGGQNKECFKIRLENLTDIEIEVNK